MTDAAGHPEDRLLSPEEFAALSSDAIGGRCEPDTPEGRRLEQYLATHPRDAETHQLDIDIAGAYRALGRDPDLQGPPVSAGGEAYYARIVDRVRLLARDAEAAAADPSGAGTSPAAVDDSVVPGPAALHRGWVPLRWQLVLGVVSAAAAALFVMTVIVPESDRRPPSREAGALARERPEPEVRRRAVSLDDERVFRDLFGEMEAAALLRRERLPSRRLRRPIPTIPASWESRLSLPERRDFRGVKVWMDEEDVIRR